MNKLSIAFAVAVLTLAGAAATNAQDSEHIHWTRNGAPTTTTIKGGPWTLEQSGAANGLKSSHYCDASLNQIGNTLPPGLPSTPDSLPGTERMEPYYFPTIFGSGQHLQGYFDWRPKDTDEAVVAAKSDDGGFSWVFQQEVLELRSMCPNQVNKEADGDAEAGPDPNNSDNGDDDGQGHQYVITVNGTTYLYTLIRASGHIDSDQLLYHILTPTPDEPLNGAPRFSEAPTDTNDFPEPSNHTKGLSHPDGILGVVPGVSPTTIIYEEKILNGDLNDPSFDAAHLCQNPWGPYYAKNNTGVSTNDDITHLRLASTTDGINFTDLGPLQGLNDIHTVAFNGTRWLATAGTILKLHGGRYGLLFSGGSCVDGDSDSFHYIGYAESTDLVHWTVVNGFDNPIATVFPATVYFDPATTTYSITPSGNAVKLTTPTTEPVVGDTQGFFGGRIYAPSGTIDGQDNLTVMFAGYHTAKPKNGLGDYRTIGRVSLHSSQSLVTGESGN